MNCASSESAALSSNAIRVYGQIAAGETPDGSDTKYVQELVSWGFVTIDARHGHKPIALPPEEVSRRNLAELLAEAASRVARMASIPAITEQLGLHYERAQWTAGHGSEYIDDPAVVNARLEDVVGSAQWEILAAQPGGPRRREILQTAVERDSTALDRGVALRTVYRATVRRDGLTAEYARTLSTRAGRRAEYRTLVAPFERAIIVDRRVAFISNHLVSDAPEHSAWQITDRSMVAYIVAEWESKWRMGDWWQGEVECRGQQQADGGPVVTSRRQREIMRDAVEGRDQQATAKRLGISLRTLAEEVKALKDIAGVSTLTGLGFWWGRSADRLVDDGVPEVTPVGVAREVAA